MTKNTFKIFAFRAVDEPDLCSKYLEGHIKVLTDYGITNITSNNNEWINNPNIYCLGLCSMKDELLGGIRIQLADGIYPLPVEKAIGYIDHKIYTIVESFALNGGVGELSGLWINNQLKGLRLGPYLIRAAIASSNQLNFHTMVGICAKYSLKMFQNVGFKIDSSLGRDGDFNYPNDNYVANVVGILNATTLHHAIQHDKKIMISLRNDPKQERVEIDSGINVNILYNLIYPKILKLNYQLSSILFEK